MNGWYAILAASIGWLIAQAWKSVAGLVKMRKTGEKMDLKSIIGYVTRSGGMPSGHSATVMALSTYIGMVAGFDSGLFAVTLVFSVIVMYDAFNVRYAVGKQGELLNKIVAKSGEKPLKVVEGHTLAQVIVGAVIGILIGVVMAILTKA